MDHSNFETTRSIWKFKTWTGVLAVVKVLIHSFFLQMTNENVGIVTNFCAYWLAKKQRNCKMRVKLGALYCAEHLTFSSLGGDDVNESDKRIPCPLDPAHSVYESRLKAHLKKCNAKVSKSLPAYFSKDINLCEDPSYDFKNTSKNPTIAELVERISQVFDNVLKQKNQPISERLKHGSKNLIVGDSEKHRLQQEALSQLILERVPKTKEKYEKIVVIEFGAGKGGLSNYLWESAFNPKKEKENISGNLSSSTLQLPVPIPMPEVEFILIDRSNSKCKKDAKMKNEGAKLQRIFIDIKDLDLGTLLESYDKERTYFLWVSKHLCGAATCLTINSCINLQKNNLKDCKGTFCVALCCHQCCSWNSYPNKEFLFKSGLIRKEHEEDSEKVFKMFCSITSWAVCGFRYKREEFISDSDSDNDVNENIKSKKLKLDTAHSSSSSNSSSNSSSSSNSTSSFPESELFSNEKKEEIGRKMKRLFDHGRQLKLNSLQDKSLDSCELKHYIEEEVTLENAVLVHHFNFE